MGNKSCKEKVTRWGRETGKAKIANMEVKVSGVNVQDAADQRKMDQPTFKNLNLGLAAIAAGNASALW